ncbi:hypothetical protein N9L47_07640 [Rhodobacteraceae bacterium]|nr:hypothetical protein [Paracoccaceae bacterium]
MFSLVSLFLLVLLIALAIAGVIRAFQGRYGTGILALLYAAALFGPDVARSIDQKVRDIDAEVLRGDDRIEVRNRGPIAFTHKSGPNKYGGRIHRFRTLAETDAGPREIGFSFWDIGSQDYKDRRTICPSEPGPAGLRKMIDAEARGPHKNVRCSVLRSTVNYMSNEGDGPSTAIRCTIVSNGTMTPCSMRIYFGRYWINVSMWDVPPEGWRGVRDHVVAVVDQSFTIVDQE